MERRQLYVTIFLLLGGLAPAHAADTRTAQPADPAPRATDSGFDRAASAPPLGQSPAFAAGREGSAVAPFSGSDVVLVIDHSTLSLVASGVDVDQDGVVGRNRIEVKERRGLLIPARFWTTDSGDTLHALQLRVAQVGS